MSWTGDSEVSTTKNEGREREVGVGGVTTRKSSNLCEDKGFWRHTEQRIEETQK